MIEKHNPDKQHLLNWHRQIEKLARSEAAIDATESQWDQFLLSLQQLEGFVVRALVRRVRELTPEELDETMKRCESPHVVFAALDALEEVAVDRPPADVTGKVLNATLILSAITRARHEDDNKDVYFATKIAPSRVIVDSLIGLVANEGALPKEKVEAALDAAHHSDYSKLSFELEEAYSNSFIPENQIDFVLALSRGLRDRQKAEQAKRRASGPTKRLERLVQKAELQELNRRLNFEGTYDITVAGKKARLTLALSPSDDDLLFAGIQYDGRGPVSSFMTGRYLGDGEIAMRRFGAISVTGLNPVEYSPNFHVKLSVGPSPIDGKPTLLINGRLDKRVAHDPRDFFPVKGHQFHWLPIVTEKKEPLDEPRISYVRLVGNCRGNRACIVEVAD